MVLSEDAPVKGAVKKLARSLGLYRQARWLNHHPLNRQELSRQKADVAFYSTFIHNGDLVFDVGANLGEMTAVFLKLGARVVAFEPQSDYMDEVKARCGNKRLITLPLALAAEEGSSKFFIRQYRGTSGLIREWGWGGEIEAEILVPTVTLDRMIVEYGRPWYIKIDVEGAEYEVLKGLGQLVPYISFEYHLRSHDIEAVFDCIRHLSGFGELRFNITPAEHLMFGYPNWLIKEEFLKIFPAEISQKEAYHYGDIFVKMI